MTAIVEQTIRKPSIGAMILALLMMSFGCLMFLFGYFVLLESRSEPAALIAAGGVAILGGSVMFISGLWLLGSLGRARMPLRIGGTGMLTSGTVWVAAAALGVLQCSGPA
jgi:hypothetical protein